MQNRDARQSALHKAMCTGIKACHAFLTPFLPGKGRAFLQNILVAPPETPPRAVRAVPKKMGPLWLAGPCPAGVFILKPRSFATCSARLRRAPCTGGSHARGPHSPAETLPGAPGASWSSSAGLPAGPEGSGGLGEAPAGASKAAAPSPPSELAAQHTDPHLYPPRGAALLSPKDALPRLDSSPKTQACSLPRQAGRAGALTTRSKQTFYLVWLQMPVPGTSVGFSSVSTTSAGHRHGLSCSPPTLLPVSQLLFVARAQLIAHNSLRKPQVTTAPVCGFLPYLWLSARARGERGKKAQHTLGGSQVPSSLVSMAGCKLQIDGLQNQARVSPAAAVAEVHSTSARRKGLM